MLVDNVKRLLSTFFLIFSITVAENGPLGSFIADTSIINIPGDSLLTPSSSISIDDKRGTPENLICILQDKKWIFVPIDHYYVLKQPLADIVYGFLREALLDADTKLIIENLSYSNDTNPLFVKGPKLNGYTKLVDSDGQIIKDWQWEIRTKKSGKKKTKEMIGNILFEWVKTQKSALTSIEPNPTISPFTYRHQLLSWIDVIYLHDGFILDGRLSLDYPTDQMKKYSRNTPSIYYRKSSLHESIAIGGKDQQWYFRLNSKWLTRINVTGRVGFNSFNTAKFDYLDWWNIFMVNVGLTGSIEYRPCYLKGLFAGVGIHQNINLLPEVIPYFETGLLFTFGVVLP